MEKNDENMLSNLEKIISANGEDKDAWSNFLCDIISGNSKLIQETLYTLKQNLIKKEKVDLTLDIIDFLINYGSIEVIDQISQKDFLNSVLFLLKNKSKASVEIQKKIIFLTQKWYKKFENEQKENTIGFINIYNSLKKGGIIFPPPSFQIETYNKYITDDESQNSLMKANVIKKSIKESEEYNNGLAFANPFSNSEDSNNNNNNNTPSDKKVGFNNDNTDETKNDNINNKEENNNQLKKNDDFDDENPYLQKDNNENENKINPFYIKKENNEKNNNFVNSNENDKNNNINNINNYNNNNENNNVHKMEQKQEQQSKYPTYPSQMSNLTNNNNNLNNNFNNNIKMNNPYLTKNKTMNTPYNNFANNNNNYNKFQHINNNNNNNYNQFNNNNNLYKSPTYNNSNYNNYNNNFKNNNNFSSYSDYSLEAKYYKRILGNKLLQLNKWINEGKYSFNSGKLKEGIQEILNEISHCNNMMRDYQSKGDKKAFETIRNMRMDIEQTCARYEALMNDKKLDPFYSSFSGNTRQYYFDKNNMFGLKEDNISGIGNFDNYYKSSGLVGPSDYGYQDYEKEKEKTFGDKISDFGNDVKDGFVKFGTAVKNTAVSGYEFIKKKIDS